MLFLYQIYNRIFKDIKIMFVYYEPGNARGMEDKYARVAQVGEGTYGYKPNDYYVLAWIEKFTRPREFLMASSWP